MSEYPRARADLAYSPVELHVPTGCEFVERDSRRLAFETYGDDNGAPVFFLHGMPGSRIGHYFLPEQLSGIKLISYDRPGYGQSDRREGRAVAESAADVARVADELGLETFGVLGRSAGGMHALACAALLGERVNSAVILNGPGPMREMGDAWFEGMANSNVAAFKMTNDEVIAHITERASEIQQSPTAQISHLRQEFTPVDEAFDDLDRLTDLFAASHAEATRQGPDGWIDDILTQHRSWGFDLSGIRVPVHFRYGKGDQFTPVSHGLWMQAAIPHATIEVSDNLSHFDPCPDLLRRFAP